MNILLIEPDKVLARTYRLALEQAGHKLSLASTAQKAIHAADSLKPDVVILEMQLVSHSGIEFLYEFRSYNDWQEVPVLVLSHVPPVEFSDSWRLLHDELGVTGYHYKPHISLEQLLRLVSSAEPVRI